MKKKGEISYKTIDDLAKDLQISVATARRYIRNGTFPPPRREFFGSQSVAVFDDAYIIRAQAILNRLRSGK